MGRRIGSLEHSDLETLSRGRVGGGQLLGWRGAVPLDLFRLLLKRGTLTLPMATNAKAVIAKRQVGSRIWEERGEEGRRGRDVLRRGGRSLKAAAPRSFYF